METTGRGAVSRLTRGPWGKTLRSFAIIRGQARARIPSRGWCDRRHTPTQRDNGSTSPRAEPRAGAVAGRLGGVGQLTSGDAAEVRAKVTPSHAKNTIRPNPNRTQRLQSGERFMKTPAFFTTSSRRAAHWPLAYAGLGIIM